MAESRIFLSYRRDDTEGYVGRLQDHLDQRFPGRVFRDISGLEPGEDYIDALQREGADCKALIAVIGKRWLTLTDGSGKRRIDDPNDILRQEIVKALQRDVRVIPLLVGGATMPGTDELPPDLAFLARRQALSISEVDFRHDMERLIRALEKAMGEVPTTPAPDDEKSDEEEVRTLLRQAAAAAAVQDWTKATQTLQAVLSIVPANAEAAALLRTAVQQKKLADLFNQGQAAFQKKDYRGALDCFRQVRVLGGNYNEVDNLIGLCQESLKDTSGLVSTPKPKRLRWVLAGFGVMLLLAGIISYVQEQNGGGNRPAPIVNGYSDNSQTTEPTKGTKGQTPAINRGTQPPADSTDNDGADVGRGEPAAGPPVQSRAPAVFQPVGRWMITSQSTGFSATLYLNPDYSFTLGNAAGPLGAGKWMYVPATRAISMSGINSSGAYFTEVIEIGNPRGNGYEIYDSFLGPAFLSAQ